MGQQHTDSYFPPPRIASTELGHGRHNRHVQVKKATLVENHGHAGSGNRLGKRCQIEPGVNGNFWRARVIGKPPDRLQSDQPAFKGDCHRRSGKRVCGYGVMQDAESSRENRVLLLKGGNRKRHGSFWDAVQKAKDLG